MNRKLKGILAGLLALTLLLVAGCGTTSGPSDGAVPEGTGLGNRAPDFQLKDTDGQYVSLSDMMGQPVMINFWASWCGPCLMEMPYIQQVYDEWSGEGLVLLAVNCGESSSRVTAFMQSYGYTFPVLLDSNGRVSDDYGVRGIPTTLFIDAYGIVQGREVGSFPSKEAIEQQLDNIMP
jgi:thiol-disulfide isomerase/thioredoxin